MSKPEYLIKRGYGEEILLIAFGLLGVLVSAFADLIGLGHPGFGIEQLAGLVIGALVAVAGIVQIISPNNRISVRLLAGIYMTGIFYAGLRPYYSGSKQYNLKVLLDFHSYGLRDFPINTIGFIPLGFLFMLSFGNRQKDQNANLFRRAIIVAAIGGLISLCLEVCQYYLIAGRASALYDLV